MTQRYYNHFAGINLVYPADQREYYETYCASNPNSTSDRKPFPRMVDLWFAALSLAAGKGLKPVELSGQNTSNFTPGSIFDRDSWRVQAVMLAAIAVEGTIDVAGDASRMMAIANGLAAAGVPHIVEMLENGKQDPIWNLSDALAESLVN